jgi:hypothetical protein
LLLNIIDRPDLFLEEPLEMKINGSVAEQLRGFAREGD